MIVYKVTQVPVWNLRCFLMYYRRGIPASSKALTVSGGQMEL